MPDTSSVIPRMESGQHVGELKVRVGVRGLETNFGNAKRTPDGSRPITMPHTVDDQTTPGGRTTKKPDSLAHHVDRYRVGLKCLRHDRLLIPHYRLMLWQAVDQPFEVVIARPLAQIRPTEFTLPAESTAQLCIRCLEALRGASIWIAD